MLVLNKSTGLLEMGDDPNFLPIVENPISIDPNTAFINELIAEKSEAGVFSIRLTDPVSGVKVRLNIRNGQFSIDKTLTELGFSGVENTDWENLGGQLL